MNTKKLSNSITLLGIILILCMFINAANAIYAQSQSSESNSIRIVSAFDG